MNLVHFANIRLTANITEMFEEIFSSVFSVEFLTVVLVLIGLYALLWWAIDNFKSLVQIATAVLRPLFQPQDDLPLKEKFGTWAGEY